MSNRNLTYPLWQLPINNIFNWIFLQIIWLMSFIIDEEAKGATAKSKITEEEQEEEATTSYIIY